MRGLALAVIPAAVFLVANHERIGENLPVAIIIAALAISASATGDGC
ncbi:MAG: hypothetical protein M3340_00240 [Actinomycetota bacterium]|nr:hypothetical protein [Actinomycetota bacterium]